MRMKEICTESKTGLYAYDSGVSRVYCALRMQTHGGVNPQMMTCFTPTRKKKRR